MVRRRRQWKKYQARIDPNRLVFIDETWAKTTIDLASEAQTMTGYAKAESGEEYANMEMFRASPL